MRRGALLKVDQNIGMSPTSVGGGENALGNCEANGGFCGPGSVKLDGLFVVLIWPCGGSSGLPKVAALAAAAAVATVPAAAAASTPREIPVPCICLLVSAQSRTLWHSSATFDQAAQFAPWAHLHH